jgi:hypothetical protein
VVLERPGDRVTVLWTMKPQPLAVGVEATGGAALRITKYGEADTIEPLGGEYRLELSAATANSNELDPQDFVVGGDQVIIVEPLDGDLAGAYRPLDVAPPSPRGISRSGV